MSLKVKIICLNLLVFFAICANAQVADTALNTLSPAEKKAGFKLLFDGKSFKGWKSYYDNVDPAKGWRIENGCLKNPKVPVGLKPAAAI